jgi:hypothetical protein
MFPHVGLFDKLAVKVPSAMLADPFVGPCTNAILLFSLELFSIIEPNDSMVFSEITAADVIVMINNPITKAKTVVMLFFMLFFPVTGAVLQDLCVVY